MDGSHPGSAAGRVHGDLHALGFHDRQTRRRGADGHGGRHDQRRHARRCSRRPSRSPARRRLWTCRAPRDRRHRPGGVSAIPSARNPFTTGVLDSWRQRGGANVPDVGGSVVQEVASLEFNGGRQSDQRMMVNGVALSTMIGGGWGGGAVRMPRGWRSSRSTSQLWMRRPRPAAYASTSSRGMAATGLAGTIFGGFATEGLRVGQLHGLRRAGARADSAAADQRERRLQSRLRRADRSRQGVVLRFRALSLRGQLRRRACSSTRTRTN